MNDTKPEARKPKPVTIVVDGEPLQLPDREITPNQILALVELDPATHYLVEINGRHQTPYEGKSEITIKVKEADTFITVSTGPTPTS